MRSRDARGWLEVAPDGSGVQRHPVRRGSCSCARLDRRGPSSYLHRMVKKAISVTLRPENLLWLRAQAHASSRRSVSETLDELISGARAGARGGPGPTDSVVGSTRRRASDPGLPPADGVIRGLFSASAARH